MDILLLLKNSIDLTSVAIALCGALLSVASALYLTSRKISAELRYRRVDLTTLYADKILAERLQHYPKLWLSMGRFDRVLVGGPAEDVVPDAAVLLSFLKDVVAWDDAYGLLLSTNSARTCFHLRMKVHSVITSYNGPEAKLLKEDDKKALLDYMSRLEIALRTDIGIYEVDKFESRPLTISYEDLNRDILKKHYNRYPDL